MLMGKKVSSALQLGELRLRLGGSATLPRLRQFQVRHHHHFFTTTVITLVLELSFCKSSIIRSRDCSSHNINPFLEFEAYHIYTSIAMSFAIRCGSSRLSMALSQLKRVFF